jgi:hypothetical protein
VHTAQWNAVPGAVAICAATLGRSLAQALAIRSASSLEQLCVAGNSLLINCRDANSRRARAFKAVVAKPGRAAAYVPGNEGVYNGPVPTKTRISSTSQQFKARPGLGHVRTKGPFPAGFAPGSPPLLELRLGQLEHKPEMACVRACARADSGTQWVRVRVAPARGQLRGGGCQRPMVVDSPRPP